MEVQEGPAVSPEILQPVDLLASKAAPDDDGGDAGCEGDDDESVDPIFYLE